MTKEKPIVLVDTGKRIKHRIGTEIYYAYVPNGGEPMVTCARENSPDIRHRRDILGVVGKEDSDYMDGGYK